MLWQKTKKHIINIIKSKRGVEMKKHGFTGSRLLISLLALVLIVSVLFNACAKATSTTTQTSTTTTQTSTTTTKTSTTTITAAQKVLKIGAVIDMRGTRGLLAKKWYDLFAKLYNDAGGWKIGNDTYNVRMILYDSQGNVTTAKDELTRLVLQDEVKFIIGWTLSGSSAVDVTITDPNKVVVFAEDLTEGSAKPNVQYYYTTGNYFARGATYRIAADMGSKGYKSYLSVKPENQVGHTMDTMFNSVWKVAAPNTKYLGTVWVDPGTIDWGPIATKIKSYNPEVVDITILGYIPNSILNTYRALSDVGYKGVILPGLMTENDLKNLNITLGKAAVEGGELPSATDPRQWQTDPRMLSLMAAYDKEYGTFLLDGANDTSQFLMLEAALNATQSIDTDVIKQYLDNSPAPVRTFNAWNQLFARPDLGTYRTMCGNPSNPLGVIHDGKITPGILVTVQDNYLATILANNLVDIYKEYWAKYGYPTFPTEQKGLNVAKWSDLGVTGRD
jgi:ABC-type branched-subunit amino acid transport system substrate-binding protein